LYNFPNVDYFVDLKYLLFTPNNKRIISLNCRKWTKMNYSFSIWRELGKNYSNNGFVQNPAILDWALYRIEITVFLF